MIELNTNKQGKGPTIKVIGVGGGGNNAINRILENGKPHENVQYVAVNTDEQVLTDSKAQEIVQIGTKLTGGYGAGADPETGEAAARESEDEITDTVTGCDMVILTAGMGGGTGTGALPVIAEICRNKGILTVAVVTMPFSFEGESHTLVAENGMESLKKNVDTLLIIPNDKLLDITDKPFYLEDAFQMEYPEKVAQIRSEEYYVNMMRAWYFATALAKQYDKILPFIEKQKLDVWTHNKTIQKAIESYRITPEQKEYLRGLKIKK